MFSFPDRPKINSSDRLIPDRTVQNYNNNSNVESDPKNLTSQVFYEKFFGTSTCPPVLACSRKRKEPPPKPIQWKISEELILDLPDFNYEAKRIFCWDKSGQAHLMLGDQLYIISDLANRRFKSMEIPNGNSIDVIGCNSTTSMAFIRDSKIHLLDKNREAITNLLPVTTRNPERYVDFDSYSSSLFATLSNKKVSLVDARSKKSNCIHKFDEEIEKGTLRWSPDHQYLAIAERTNLMIFDIRFINSSTITTRQSGTTFRESIRSITWEESVTAPKLAVCSNGIEAINLKTQEVASFPIKTSQIEQIDWNKGKLMIREGQSVSITDINKIEHHNSTITLVDQTLNTHSATINPQGTKIALIATDEKLHIYQMPEIVERLEPVRKKFRPSLLETHVIR